MAVRRRSLLPHDAERDLSAIAKFLVGFTDNPCPTERAQTCAQQLQWEQTEVFRNFDRDPENGSGGT